MIPLQYVANRVLTDVVKRQPPSKARTSFAWQLAVGPALARATTVELADGVLMVRSHDPRWAQEIDRARTIVLRNMQRLLGDDVKRIETRRQ